MKSCCADWHVIEVWCLLEMFGLSPQYRNTFECCEIQHLVILKLRFKIVNDQAFVVVAPWLS